MSAVGAEFSTRTFEVFTSAARVCGVRVTASYVTTLSAIAAFSAVHAALASAPIFGIRTGRPESMLIIVEPACIATTFERSASMMSET
jgi:hypothetical protein